MTTQTTAGGRERKIIEEIEMLSETYKDEKPSYGINQRFILERRWEAYKFIKLGVHTIKDSEKALQLIKRLMNIADSKHSNKKDDWLLNKLANRIEQFEKIYK